MIDISACPKVSPNVSWRKEKNSILVFNKKTQLVYELNSEAGLLLDLCDGQNSLGIIQDRFTQITNRPDLASEFPGFLDELKTLGIVELQEERSRG